MPAQTRTMQPCIRMQIRDGELHYKRHAYREDAEHDADRAIRRLLNGEVVWIFQLAPLVNRVQRAVESALQRRLAA